MSEKILGSIVQHAWEKVLKNRFTISTALDYIFIQESNIDVKNYTKHEMKKTFSRIMEELFDKQDHVDVTERSPEHTHELIIRAESIIISPHQLKMIMLEMKHELERHFKLIEVLGGADEDEDNNSR